MLDPTRCVGVNLPATADDPARWEAMRPNSLSVWIPHNVRPDLSWIVGLRGLRDLGTSGVARGRVELDDLLGAAKIESLSVNLRSLEFHGSTRVADGRVAFLSDLPALRHVRFMNRATYDATRESIWVRLGRER